eukprot:GHVS01064142.1.p1 GENE.GHVS01064142.1~~GHVS01064142.1.p1  ORF type:complete len:663 (-),score=92.83 GHVS01064142.1:112-2100(-)
MVWRKRRRWRGIVVGAVLLAAFTVSAELRLVSPLATPSWGETAEDESPSSVERSWDRSRGGGLHHEFTPSKRLTSEHESSLTICHGTSFRRLQDDEAQPMKSLSSFSGLDALGVVLIAVVCILAITVGMGGGGLFVPILILVMGFTAHAATALSQTLMVGAALAALILNSVHRHPVDRDLPLIDIDKVLLLGPMMTAGALLGVQINKMLAVVAILFFMLVVLSFSSYLTFSSAVVACRKERRRRSLLRERNSAAPDFCDKSATQIKCHRCDSSSAVESAAVTADPSVSKSPSLPAYLVRGLDLAHPKIITVAAQLPKLAPCVGQPRELSLQCSQSLEKGRSAMYDIEEEVDTNYARRQQYVLSGKIEEEMEALGDGHDGQKPQEEWDTVAVESPPAPPLGDQSESTVSWEQKPTAKLQQTPTKKIVQWVRKSSLLHPPKTDWKKSLLVFVIWAINIGLTLIRGGKKSEIHVVEYCGVGYWLLFAASVLLQILWSVGFATFLWKTQAPPRSQLVKGEITYDPVVLLTWCFISLIAGIIAGIVGIGGGMILGPIMLKKGMIPQVVSAVNATLILISASSAATAHLASGAMDIDWALVLASTCFVAALFGKFVLDGIVIRYHLSSLLVVLLLCMVLLSAAALLVAGIISIVDDPQKATTFNGPCA